MFFFKQKTAYEMRISDWSSDVCSSDLEVPKAVLFSKNSLAPLTKFGRMARALLRSCTRTLRWLFSGLPPRLLPVNDNWTVRELIAVIFRSVLILPAGRLPELGRASGRERMGQNVLYTVAAVLSDKK